MEIVQKKGTSCRRLPQTKFFDERTKGWACVLSRYFAHICSPNLVLTPSQSITTIHAKPFVRSSSTLRLGANGRNKNEIVMSKPRTQPTAQVCGIDPTDTRCNSKATQNKGFCAVNASSNRCVFAPNPQRPHQKYTLKEIRTLLRQGSDTPAVAPASTAPTVAPPPPIEPIQTTCLRCVNPYGDGDDGPCPMHAECAPGTCTRHSPHWHRFCTQGTPLSPTQRYYLQRWVVDVSPGDDVTHATVAAMSDQTLCAEIARLDAEWRRPLHEPDLFDFDGEYYVSDVPFSDVPHEVLGTYPMTDAKTKCFDIRWVDRWWKHQDRTNQRRNVPFFHKQDDQPYFRALTRELEGRMRFATEQHSELATIQHETFDLIATVAKVKDGRGPLDWMETQQATARILVLVQQSERDCAIVAEVAVAPLVSLLSYRGGSTPKFAAEALYWIAQIGGYTRIRQIAQAKAAESLVAMIRSEIGAWRHQSNECIRWASWVLFKLAHPSTILLVVQAGATLPLVEALKQVRNYTTRSEAFRAVAMALAYIIDFDKTQLTLMLDAGAMTTVVQTLNASHLSSMRSVSAAAYLIGTIATIPNGRMAIHDAGGIRPLVALLAVNSTMEPNLCKNVTYVLSEIADCETCRLEMISAHAVDALQRVFSQHGDPIVRENAGIALQRLLS